MLNEEILGIFFWNNLSEIGKLCEEILEKFWKHFAKTFKETFW